MLPMLALTASLLLTNPPSPMGSVAPFQVLSSATRIEASAYGHGLHVSFAFAPAPSGLYACTLRPDVTSVKDGACTLCGAPMQVPTHAVTIRVERQGMYRLPPTARLAGDANLVRVTLTKEGGPAADMILAGGNRDTACLRLLPGRYTVSATIRRAGDDREESFPVSVDVP